MPGRLRDLIIAAFEGGTGRTTLAPHGVVIGNGGSPVSVTSAGTSGQVLTSNGASSDPTFQAAGAGSSGATAYAVTLANVDNSSVLTTYASVSIPANDWADGQEILFTVLIKKLQNVTGGGTVTFDAQLFWGANGASVYSSPTTHSASASTFQINNQWRIRRIGTSIYFTTRPVTTLVGTNDDYAPNTFNCGNILTGQSFSSTITLALKMQWGIADANVKWEPIGATCTRYS